MPKPEQIKWGSYKNFEGPVYYGRHKYALPHNANEGEKQLLVLTTTEGGTYDAYNGYDVCISTSGLIQWCDKAPYFLVCKMFGAVAEKNIGLLQPVVSLAREFGWSFERNTKGGWRWFKDGVEMTTKDQQRELYFGGASGNKGSFTEEQRIHAKRWAAAVSDVWEDPDARAIQRAYTLPRLEGFLVSSARKVFDVAKQHNNAVTKTFRAAYISFAANNPRKAGEALAKTVDDYGMDFDEEWLVKCLKNLTFLPNIAIYPHRYDKIRPVLERLYGLDLPDFAGELESWSAVNEFDMNSHTPRGLQLALEVLGYDIGPAGADGYFGSRSKSALMQFEKDEGIPSKHCDGCPDEHTVPVMRIALEQKGMCFDFNA